MATQPTTKSIKTRIQNKHAVEADWNLAVNFTPLAGELIVYDPDADHTMPRLKIGDGVKKVTELPFIDADLLDVIQRKIENNISYGTADPTSSTPGKYYFKYSS